MADLYLHKETDEGAWIECTLQGVGCPVKHHVCEPQDDGSEPEAEEKKPVSRRMSRLMLRVRG